MRHTIHAIHMRGVELADAVPMYARPVVAEIVRDNDRDGLSLRR